MTVRWTLNFSLCVLLSSLVLCLLVSLGHADDSTTVNPPTPINLSGEPTLDPRAIEGFQNGLVLRGIGENYAAIANLREALRYDPKSDVIKQTLAELYFSLRAPKEALDLLDQVVSRDADFYRLQGACYQSVNDDVGARKAFLELVKLEPDNELALGYILNSYRQANDTPATIWTLEQLTHVKPDDPGTWNDLGRLYASKGQTEKTKEAFQTSLSLDSSGANLVAYSFLADVYTFQNHLDSAQMVLKQALRIDKDNVFLNNQLIGTYLQRDSMAEALPFAQRVAELRPTDGRVQRRLGIIYLRMDSLGIADSIFRDLVNGGDDAPADHYFLGQIAMQQKRFDTARAQFEILVQKEDTVEQNWQSLGVSLIQLGDTAQAKQAYLRGIQHVVDDSGRARLTYSLASILERSGQFDSAVVKFRDLLAKWPRFSPALNYLGYMYADKGTNLEEAKSLIEQAVKAEPDNAAYLDSYGWVYYRLNNFKQALEQLKKAASLTKDATVFEHLGDTYKALGKKSDAREWWQKALELDPKNTGLKDKISQ